MEYYEVWLEYDKIKAAFPLHFTKCIDISGHAEWLDPIKDLCTFVDALLKQDNYEHEFHWIQIKNKFGRLRAYYDFNGPGEIRNLIDTAIMAAEITIEQLNTSEQ